MEEFLKQLLAKLASLLLFFALMLFLFACMLTGEFPPKIESVRTQYQTLVELKRNSIQMMKAASEKMRALENAAANQPSLPQASAQASAGPFSQQDLGEIRREQIRLKNQMDLIVQQNNEILRLLSRTAK